MNANSIQIGGDHYKGGGNHEHWDIIAQLYGPGYFIAAATKYVQRWRKKNGAQDLEKARHYVVKLIELIQTGKITEAQLKPLTFEHTQEYLDANGVVSMDRTVLAYLFGASDVEHLVRAGLVLERMLLNWLDGEER